VGIDAALQYTVGLCAALQWGSSHLHYASVIKYNSVYVQAGAKSTAATSLKFQAEATAHLQNTGVGRTQDAPKYQDKDIEVRHATLSRRLVSSCSKVLESLVHLLP